MCCGWWLKREPVLQGCVTGIAGWPWGWPCSIHPWGVQRGTLWRAHSAPTSQSWSVPTGAYSVCVLTCNKSFGERDNWAICTIHFAEFPQTVFFAIDEQKIWNFYLWKSIFVSKGRLVITILIWFCCMNNVQYNCLTSGCTLLSQPTILLQIQKGTHLHPRSRSYTLVLFKDLVSRRVKITFFVQLYLSVNQSNAYLRIPRVMVLKCLCLNSYLSFYIRFLCHHSLSMFCSIYMY